MATGAKIRTSPIGLEKVPAGKIYQGIGSSNDWLIIFNLPIDHHNDKDHLQVMTSNSCILLTMKHNTIILCEPSQRNFLQRLLL
jgi:hypothetical protein